MKRIIGAEHEFHDSRYAQDWAARFDPTPERLQLFDLIISQLQSRSLPARPPDSRSQGGGPRRARSPKHRYAAAGAPALTFAAQPE